MGKKVLSILAISIAVLYIGFVVTLWAPIIKPHRNFAIYKDYGIQIVPVKDPYTKEVITSLLHWGGGYQYDHIYGFKGFPESSMERAGGANFDFKIMRKIITTGGVSGPWVLSGWINYTLPGHQIGCSFGSRESWNLYCYDFEQQKVLVRIFSKAQ